MEVQHRAAGAAAGAGTGAAAQPRRASRLPGLRQRRRRELARQRRAGLRTLGPLVGRRRHPRCPVERLDKGAALLMSFLFRELTGAAATAPAATSGAESSAGASTTLAACLRRAQIKLYQTDAPTAKAVLEDFGAACTALEAPAHISRGHKTKILNTLHAAIAAAAIAAEAGQRQYSHPFFWAPFVLVGHGGQRLKISRPGAV